MLLQNCHLPNQMSEAVITLPQLHMPITCFSINDYPRAWAESADEVGSERESNEETDLGFHRQACPLIAPSCHSHHGSGGSLWPRLLWSPRVMRDPARAERGARPAQMCRTYLILITIKVTYHSFEIIRGWISCWNPNPRYLRMWPY